MKKVKLTRKSIKKIEVIIMATKCETLCRCPIMPVHAVGALQVYYRGVEF